MIDIDSLLGLLAPHVCIRCATEGAVLCEGCRLSELLDPVSRCAGRQTLTVNFKVCASCRSWLPFYAVYTATDDSSLAEQLIEVAKFQAKRQALQPIARQMIEHLPDLPTGTTVVPIPTAPARVRERGFDHAARLARAIARARKLSYETLLERRSNVRQVGASRQERIRHMANEFTLKPHAKLPETILLVDDVMTTGASLSAAAHLLKDAGVRRVYAAVFIRKN